MPNSPLKARLTLAVGYLLFAAAGAAAVAWPSPSVARAGRVWATVWALFLVLGGLASAFGAVRRIWVGEYVGLPLLISVWGVYGIAAGYAAIANHSLRSIAGCAALLGVACLLTYRWEIVADYRRGAHETAHRRAP